MIRWRPLNAMTRNVSVVTAPPTVSKATSTPRPLVTSSTKATKSSAAVVHGVVGAQGSAEGNLVVRARRGDHRGAERLGQLHGGRAGTSGRRVDEDDVAWADPSSDAQRQVAEEEREVHARSPRLR